VPYYSVSVALNVVLTLMIIVRVFWHIRDFQHATGSRATAGGLYKSIVTMLVESCSLYAIALLVCIVLENVTYHDSSANPADIFWPALMEIQVRPTFTIP
jgi:hypothetical protein